MRSEEMEQSSSSVTNHTLPAEVRINRRCALHIRCSYVVRIYVNYNLTNVVEMNGVT
jgi:hypothetical protein